MLDAADDEPCGDDNPGALQFDAVSGRLDVCDTAAWTRVLSSQRRRVLVEGLAPSRDGAAAPTSPAQAASAKKSGIRRMDYSVSGRSTPRRMV